MKRLLILLALAPLSAVYPAWAAVQASAYTVQLGKLINDYRAQHHLQPLASAPALSELAQEHAAHMAREDRLSHDGFQQRFANAHSPSCVENVGSYGTPGAEFEAWRNSPMHERNLLDSRITRMGIAIEGRYVTFFACQ